MIIAPKFVFLNFPKTGSTFVRTMIQQIEEQRGHTVRRINFTRKKGKIDYVLWLFGLRDYEMVRLKRERLWESQPPDEHGGVSQIPWGFRGRPVACVIRHPLDRTVSEYYFQWYKKHPAAPAESIRERIPSFPDITFEEYLNYQERFRRPAMLKNAGVDETLDIGCQTIDFVRQLFKEPARALVRLSDTFIQSGEFKEYMPESLHLLQTRTLNQDLAEFLQSVGYTEKEVTLVRDHEKVQPGPGTERTSEDDWHSHYTEAHLDRVVHEERFLFQMLSHLGFSYDLTPFTA